MKRFVIALLVVMLFMPAALADELRIKDIDWAYGRYFFVEALVEQKTDSGKYAYTVQKYGVIDLDGNIVIEPIWDNYYVFDEGMMWFESYDREEYAIYDEGGKHISTFNVPEEADSIRQFENGYALIEVDGLWGYMDIYGEIVIEPQYEMDMWAGFEPDDYFVEKYSFYESLAVVVLDGKYGYIDETGEVAIPFVYDAAFAFDGGQAIVYYTSDGMEFGGGVIDIAGNWIINPEWEDITKLENGAYLVKANGKYGVIDGNGKTIIDIKYSRVVYDDELNGYILYMDPGYGTADEHGNIIIEPVYYHIGYYDGDTALARKDGNDVLIDKEGNEIPGFTNDLPITNGIQIGEGYIRISAPKEGNTDEENLYGVISSAGEVIAEPVYDRVGICSCGRIDVCKDGKWGFIDTEGNVVIDIIYDEVWDFGGGIAPVKLGDKIRFIDMDGNPVTDFIWNECIESWSNEMVRGNPCYEFEGEYRYAARKGTDWHIIDNEGNIIR